MRKVFIATMGLVILLAAFPSLSSAATPEFYHDQTAFDARLSALAVLPTTEYIINFEPDKYSLGETVGPYLIPTVGTPAEANVFLNEISSIWDDVGNQFAFSSLQDRTISGTRTGYHMKVGNFPCPGSGDVLNVCGVYNAISFRIIHWDPATLQGRVEVLFDDGTFSGIDFNRGGTTENDPEFFGLIVTGANILAINWLEPGEVTGSGWEETGLDDIRVIRFTNVIFNDDFNGDTLGGNPNLSPAGFPPGDSITSNCSAGGNDPSLLCSPSEFYVGVPPNMNSPHLAVKNITNAPRIFFHPDPAEATGSVFTISWRSVSDPWNSAFFDLYTSNRGGPAARVAYGSDGKIYSPADVPSLKLYKTDSSQLFSMVVNLATGQYDLFIDGEIFVAGANLDDSNNSGDFASGGLVLWENTSGKMIWVDDVRMFRGADTNGDGVPDGVDSDGDGIPDSSDNCPADYNPDQADGDVNPDGTPNPDGVGDLCDNCPTTYNPPDGELGQADVCSANSSGDTGKLSPVLVQGCFQFTDPTKEYVVRPTCANTVWELTDSTGTVLPVTGCVNGPAVGIPDDLVPISILDSFGNPITPITYCTEPCNLLDRFSPDVLTPPPGETITYQARGTFTTLIQCPPGDSDIPLSETDPTNVCPKILMVSVTTDPITLEILPEKNRLIDVYPGTYPNLINLGATGTTPVAIIGSPTFDVRKVDLDTVTMAGAPVASYTDKKTKKKVYQSSIKDFNGDGYLDLIVHFVTSQLGISGESTTITLTGNKVINDEEVPFTGEDSIQVVRGSKK